MLGGGGVSGLQVTQHDILLAHVRYGPSVTKGTLRDKIFHGRSKTELYYYGGQTFTAAPSTSSKSESAVKGSSSRLFTPGSSEML